MKENPNNVVDICKDCSDERRELFQKTFDPITLNIGDSIKAAFTDENGTEHMWVTVTRINRLSIRGELDNIPVVVKNLKLGDIVNIKFEEIEQIL